MMLNFGDAIVALRKGEKVARSGWNGKGMYLMLQKGTTIRSKDARGGIAASIAFKSDGIKIGAHIDMLAADGSVVVGWLASQTDMLAEDWVIVP